MSITAGELAKRLIKNTNYLIGRSILPQRGDYFLTSEELAKKYPEWSEEIRSSIFPHLAQPDFCDCL